MLIDSITEGMFAQAVALAQNGRMKSTIHCGGSEIFIMNMDSTLLLRYRSPQEFSEPFSFFANDYESPRIRVEDGKIVFIQNHEGIRRTKVCTAPGLSFVEAKKLWDGFKVTKEFAITLTKELTDFLEDSLSHVELGKAEGDPVLLVQRDIYSGTRIEIQKNKSARSLFELEDIELTFGPLGIRTVDFRALFTFCSSLTFYIQPNTPWIYFEDNLQVMSGILGLCLYDELGVVGKIK